MPPDSPESQNSVTTTAKLGTFAGVFTPSILTILGIILFLRLGYVVGAAGFGRVLLIMIIANGISILTSMSLSAVATNIQVKGGGDYYLISRTLGVQFGGSLGLVLFLAQSVSIAFYTIGFGEAMVALLPPLTWINAQTIAALAVMLLFILAWMGADWATKFQYIVMALLVSALLSFFIGAVGKFHFPQLVQNWPIPSETLPFWVLFAIFFPAVTGFTQGVSMSGDLENPGKSLPLGTFLAVGTSIIIYFAVAVLFAGALTNESLAADYNAMKKIALMPGIIDAGVIAATLSSAMASFLGAPRILQSLAKDQIFKLLNPFAQGQGPSDNPRHAVILSGAIALFTILLGQLNLIAQIVSMFFLISYGLLNYATFFEARSASPAFRPRFRWFNPWLSLSGFMLCLGAMVAIDFKTGLIALFFLAAIYQYLKRTAGAARWADSRRSNYLQRVRDNLQAAAAEPEHGRDWRPFIVAFTNDPDRRERLLTFAKWLEGGAGFIIAVKMVEGEGAQLKTQRQKVHLELTQQIRELNQSIYPLALAANDISEALPIMVQAIGMGPVKANTLLVNWMDQLAKGLSGIGALKYAENLRIAHRQGLNLIILKADEQCWDKIESKQNETLIIDVWWSNDATSRLMLLFAYLVTRTPNWEDSRIRVITTGTGRNVAQTNRELQELLDAYRIEAEPVIVPDNSLETTLTYASKATLVFLPFRIRNFKILDASGNPLTRLLPKLPLTALFMAAEDIDLTAEPDSGAAGDLAAATDTLSAMEKRVRLAEKEAHRCREAADKITARLSKLERTDERRDQLIKEADEAIHQLDQAQRKVARAKAKADEAGRHLLQLTGKPETAEETAVKQL